MKKVAAFLYLMSMSYAAFAGTLTIAIPGTPENRPVVRITGVMVLPIADDISQIHEDSKVSLIIHGNQLVDCDTRHIPRGACSASKECEIRFSAKNKDQALATAKLLQDGADITCFPKNENIGRDGYIQFEAKNFSISTRVKAE